MIDSYIYRERAAICAHNIHNKNQFQMIPCECGRMWTVSSIRIFVGCWLVFLSVFSLFLSTFLLSLVHSLTRSRSIVCLPHSLSIPISFSGSAQLSSALLCYNNIYYYCWCIWNGTNIYIFLYFFCLLNFHLGLVSFDVSNKLTWISDNKNRNNF